MAYEGSVEAQAICMAFGTSIDPDGGAAAPPEHGNLTVVFALWEGGFLEACRSRLYDVSLHMGISRRKLGGR